MEAVTLRTARLTLHALTPGVIRRLFETGTRETIMAYLGTDEAGYIRYKQMNEAGLEMYRISLYYFLLFDTARGLPVGECGFHTWNTYHRRAELFYSLRHDADRQKGLMTEALGAVIAFGFDRMGLHRVQGLVAADNLPSVKLLEKYGFRRESVIRQDYNVDGSMEDSVCYALLRPEWEARSVRGPAAG